jgi:glycosyltransferase involved in cell wall biosynthesis
MPALVSVIIPTYNRAALLRETISSVLAQTYPAIEIVVVDDGSTDATPELLASYGDRIRVIRKQNGGGTAARNTGILAAHGEFISVLDHDDLLLPEKIARQVALLEARPELGLVHCGYYRMDHAGRYLDKVIDLPEGDVRMQIVLGCFIWSGAPLIRRAVFDEVGLFDEQIWSSDADMWLKIALAGYPFGCVQEPLGAYRILHDSSMADVERTERMDARILEWVFADPRLPAAARPLENEAHFNQRFWLACRYYTLGRWDDAQRNLRMAIERKPALLNNPRDLLQRFCTNALDPRVVDPVRFVEQLYQYLPPEVLAVAAPFRESLLSWVYIGMAMRNYAYGQIDLAREQLAQAVQIDPGIPQRPDEFSAALVDFALRLPVTPTTYITTVLENLPAAAQPLQRVRNQALSAVQISQAFRNYQRGQRRRVPAQVLSAVRLRPALLANRGVLAIFARSLKEL